MARSVHRGVLERFPDGALSALIVWIDVIASDGAQGASRAATIFDDPRVRQFHDAGRHAGRAFASLVDMPPVSAVGGGADWESAFQHDFVHGRPAVFDSVFFFGPGVTWTDPAPTPQAWVTQLDPTVWPGIDPARFRYGEALEAELFRLAEDLMGL